VVVVCHGVGSNRAAFFGIAEVAVSLGCHALAIDLRAHGESGGWVSTFGANEVHDVAAAAKWLRSDAQFAAVPIVLVGVSMGAAVVLRTAGCVGAAGVLAESSFADLSAMIAVQTTRLGPLGGLAARAVQWAAWCQLGLAVPDVSPRASLLTLPPSVPVILLHAGDDEVVPVDEGRRLAEARRGIELEVFPGASHGCCSTADPLRFRRLLGDLLDRVRRNAAR
jgi:uncharacterized protein